MTMSCNTSDPNCVSVEDTDTVVIGCDTTTPYYAYTNGVSSTHVCENEDRLNNTIDLEDSSSEAEDNIRVASRRNVYQFGRNAFRLSLCDSESQVDLQKLYPTSLWHHGLIDKGQDERTFLVGMIWKANNQEQDGCDISGCVCSEEEWHQIELYEFCTYNDINEKRHPGQFESLHTIASEQEKRKYHVDGNIQHGLKTFTLQGATILAVSIGGLELGSDSCQDRIWIQTKVSATYDVWYLLKTPSNEYKSYWVDFYWIAMFAKYCIDYFTIADVRHRPVVLEDFKSDFKAKISEIYGNAGSFKNWATQVKETDDMRRHIVQFGLFVYDQYYSIAPDGAWKTEPLWGEIGYVLSENTAGDKKTVVTHNVATTFLHCFPEWGPSKYNVLERFRCEDAVELQRQQRIKTLSLIDKFKHDQQHNFRTENGITLSKVDWTLNEASRGNTTVLCRPEELVNKLVIIRQSYRSGHCFDFALVKSLTANKKYIRLIWLTIPSRTICAHPKAGDTTSLSARPMSYAHYPIGNELFYSDDCNCFAVTIQDVVGVYNISTSIENGVGVNPDFFVVTQYIEGEQCFIKPDESSMMYTCQIQCMGQNIAPRNHSTRATPRRSRTSQSRSEPRLPDGANHYRHLTNISLFSGCGLFDRALEADDTIQTKLSIEQDPFAVCSARANQKLGTNRSADTEFLVSSVNVELRKIMSGQAPFHDFDCLSAGCPCPGFSSANMNKLSQKSVRDCTLLAATLSWIEVLLPAYVVIENVPGMDSGSPSPCSQAIAFLVALGYQVRKCILKAEEYGGSTLRKRLFIVAAVPAVKLPDSPKPTHGNKGELPQYRTISKEISDLAAVHNDTLVNISDPYHVPLARLVANVNSDKPNFRDMISRIPKKPAGQGLVDSVQYLNASQRRWFDNLHSMKRSPNSASMRRIKADGFFRTIVTELHWKCANVGQVFHYDQDRAITLEEAARAQGVPKDFVLVGSLLQRLRQVGNAVPWCLREAVGKEIAKAYRQSSPLQIHPNSVSKNVSRDLKARVGKETVTNKDHESDDDEVMIGSKADFDKAAMSMNKSNSAFNNVSRTFTVTRSVDEHESDPEQMLKIRKRLRSGSIIDADAKGGKKRAKMATAK